jgi:hypothetical protein
MMRAAAAWLGLGAATVALGWALDRIGLPSSYLFAALVLGLAVAVAPTRSALEVPDPVFTASQAVCGVVLGAYLESSALTAVADSWLPVALVSAGTLAASLAVGAVVARTTSVDEPTAALGMVAGGASGIVAMADELGADDRLVAFMQYLRVLVVVLLTPVLAGLFFPGGTGTAAAGAGDGGLLGTPLDWAVTLACAPVGMVAGRVARVPAATLLGPMAVAGALTLTGAVDFAVPPLLREAAFIGIGLQVGLRFTPATVRAVGRLLGPVLLAIAALMVACFGLALVLYGTAGVTLEDAYLATTPGGLYAVLAVAFGAEANTTFILAVQSLRLLVMVLLAPLAVRLLVRPAAR